LDGAQFEVLRGVYISLGIKVSGSCTYHREKKKKNCSCALGIYKGNLKL
jgi:hypothetical protein